MSLKCPSCGSTLSLNLTLEAPQSDPTVAPTLPQVEPQDRVGGVLASKKPRYQYNDEAFLRFWSAYPRRVGKASAFSAWKRVVAEVEPQVVIEAAAQYGAQVEGLEPQFIKYPEGWLNSGRWDDEKPTPPPAAGDTDPAWIVGTEEWNLRVLAEEEAAIAAMNGEG